MKKLLTVSLAALLMTTSAAFAETDIITAVDKNNRVSISVTSDSTDNTLYTVMIMKPGQKLGDNTSAGSIENVYRLETIKNGESLSFDIKESDGTGLFQVISGGGELEGRLSCFAIADKATKDEALKKLNGAGAADVKAVLDEYNNKVWVIDFNNKYYLADANDVMKSFLNNLNKSAECAADVEKAYHNACILYKIKKASASELLGLIESYKDELGISYSELIGSGDESIMRAFTYIAKDSAANPINSPKQLENALKKAEALGCVNSADRKNMQQLIEKYPSELEIDITGRYASADKYEIIKRLVKENGNEYMSIKEFSDAFKSAVDTVADAAEKPADTRGNGSSGGSSSGGGSSRGGSFSMDNSYNVSDPGSILGTKSDNKSDFFNDVDSSDWAMTYIDYAAYKGIMSGDGDGNFRPNDEIKREEFLKIVIEALNVDGKDATEKEFGFNDVSKEDWFYKYVESGVNHNIITGVSDDLFGTGRDLSRQDAAVILMRAKESAELVLSETENEIDFTDKNEISDYASESVTKLQKAGIIGGYEDGSFRPNSGITRAEAAKIIYGILKNTNNL